MKIEIEDDLNIIWVSSDDADLIASKIFEWEIASYSLLMELGLQELHPAILGRIENEDVKARMWIETLMDEDQLEEEAREELREVGLILEPGDRRNPRDLLRREPS